MKIDCPCFSLPKSINSCVRSTHFYLVYSANLSAQTYDIGLTKSSIKDVEKYNYILNRKVNAAIAFLT